MKTEARGNSAKPAAGTVGLGKPGRPKKGQEKSTATPEQPTLTLTIGEAAKLLRIGRGAAYQAARNNQLPVIRLGRRRLVSRAALEALLANPNR